MGYSRCLQAGGIHDVYRYWVFTMNCKKQHKKSRKSVANNQIMSSINVTYFIY